MFVDCSFLKLGKNPDLYPNQKSDVDSRHKVVYPVRNANVATNLHIPTKFGNSCTVQYIFSRPRICLIKDLNNYFV
jgi:hypothetical protein